jgi:hypothetical protein
VFSDPVVESLFDLEQVDSERFKHRLDFRGKQRVNSVHDRHYVPVIPTAKPPKARPAEKPEEPTNANHPPHVDREQTPTAAGTTTRRFRSLQRPH